MVSLYSALSEYTAELHQKQILSDQERYLITQEEPVLRKYLRELFADESLDAEILRRRFVSGVPDVGHSIRGMFNGHFS